ncbi:hypothetical protein [Bacillus sp. TL12]|uniref:hypothetical protein n=1 Tax=Bacillus sp. TL12 TaxID=2894756 RepID=UPI001F51DE72|nr:hypothetical protein [Bacillus sp. TL12]MCI0767376.1 hypothetical protein [Bacillus sp. TL12]
MRCRRYKQLYRYKTKGNKSRYDWYLDFWKEMHKRNATIKEMRYTHKNILDTLDPTFEWIRSGIQQFVFFVPKEIRDSDNRWDCPCINVKEWDK